MRRVTPLAAALLTSCVSTTSVVRTRFAKEQSCPEEEVTITLEGGSLYRARGCDKETTYACGSVAGFQGGVQCVEEGFPSPRAPRDPDRPVMPPPDPGISAPQ
jgi:hypothetical protein